MSKLPILIAVAIIVAIVATSCVILLGNSHARESINVNALAEKCIVLRSINKSMIAVVAVHECSYCNIVKKRVHVYEIMLMENNRIVCKRDVDIPLTSGSALIYPPCMPKAPGVYKLCIKLSTGEVMCENNALLVIMS
ncbi:MAG: hypothetical protein GXO26_01585 [Crenarchaeota archaeon]|nr:hypothetical protein [Thermoproteota archaeon]